MAELATIARPYAEALFKATTGANGTLLAEQVAALATAASDEALLQFADNPKVEASQVFDVVTGAIPWVLDDRVKNLLRVVIDNGRLVAMPEIAAQYHALVNASSGTSDALVESAFPLDDGQLSQVAATLEQRFGRKLNTRVEVDPGLIGGIRVTVGDEVLDTSVKAKLERMKAALTA